VRLVEAVYSAEDQGSAQRAFHQSRMKESAASQANVKMMVRVRPVAPGELAAVATLRARAFHVYPPERAWAGQVRPFPLPQLERRVGCGGGSCGSTPLLPAGGAADARHGGRGGAAAAASVGGGRA
jgi:hypothetical protein